MAVPKEFITNLQGKEFVTYEGLINEFHKNGGKEIYTEELPAITLGEHDTLFKFKATVSGERGSFTAHGDAATINVGKMIAKHKYRMAETRAIARALRLYNNIGMTSDVEME